MQSLKDKLNSLARAMGKPEVQDGYTNYESLRKEYERQANAEVRQLQQNSKIKRISDLHGRSDLNPRWTFANLVEDSEDVIDAVSIAHS